MYVDFLSPRNSGSKKKVMHSGNGRGGMGWMLTIMHTHRERERLDGAGEAAEQST